MSEITSKYSLAPGTQVREEDFGLLFYTQTGPRLYFLPSRDLLGCGVFDGNTTVSQWLVDHDAYQTASAQEVQSLNKALEQLKDKGVLIGF